MKAIIKGHTLRIPTRVVLYDKKGKVAHRYFKTIKSRMIDTIQVRLLSECDLKGVCRVTYNSDKDHWNEFNFKTFEDFQKSYDEVTEKQLVRDYL